MSNEERSSSHLGEERSLDGNTTNKELTQREQLVNQSQRVQDLVQSQKLANSSDQVTTQLERQESINQSRSPQVMSPVAPVMQRVEEEDNEQEIDWEKDLDTSNGFSEGKDENQNNNGSNEPLNQPINELLSSQGKVPPIVSNLKTQPGKGEPEESTEEFEDSLTKLLLEDYEYSEESIEEPEDIIGRFSTPQGRIGRFLVE